MFKVSELPATLHFPHQMPNTFKKQQFSLLHLFEMHYMMKQFAYYILLLLARFLEQIQLSVMTLCLSN